MMKKHLIITSSDKKYADFLLHHWLISLETNVNLKDIDVVILDYGLTEDQKQILQSHKITVISCQKNGHITTIRFIDAGKFLQKTDYEQVLSIDSGDTIFLGDISHLFEIHKNFYRALKTDFNPLYYEFYISFNFKKEIQLELWRVLKGKPVYNAGVIFAPRQKFIHLCQTIDKLIINKRKYASDQVIVNYILHQNRVHELEDRYNFLPGVTKKNYYVENGNFYIKKNTPVVIVHNGGRFKLFRSIKNFGFGNGYNKIDHLKHYIVRLFYKGVGLIKTAMTFLNLSESGTLFPPSS